MDQIHFKDPVAAQEIQNLFKSSQLIPFFGSGFTRGEKSKKARVPDGGELIHKITATVAENAKLTDEEKKEIRSIQSLKVAFGLLDDAEYITNKERQALLSNFFSLVDLSDINKINLLKLDWPHIFTFNIDDAIERVRHDFKILRPNRRTSREFISANNCIFKLHGDITEFIEHDDPNLIFTWRDYVRFKENRALLSFLEEEATNSAFLFIGCSLDAEIDLLHLAKNAKFSKSIYIKKGRLTVEEKLRVKDYGISTVIYFDNYDEISGWIFNVLDGVVRDAPVRSIEFDDSELQKKIAISIIANGGPIYRVSGIKRLAVNSKTFALRSSLIDDATRLIRGNDCLLITGKRFSGKTLFLFQLLFSLKHYNIIFWGSMDSYNPRYKREMERLENHIFAFDSNSLSIESLEEILNIKMHHTNKILLCESFGGAERVRSKLSDKKIKFSEINLPSHLSKEECIDFNMSLGLSGLPLYKGKPTPESFINYAYRCYEEYKSDLHGSSIFDKNFNDDVYSLLVLIVASGKATKSQIRCINSHFDSNDFINSYDRIFEIDIDASGNHSLVCNSSTWLLKTLKELISSKREFYTHVVKLIVSLEENGFSSTAKDLMRFDRLNEIAGEAGNSGFIRSIYLNLFAIYSDEPHYWLQRAKAELISSKTEGEVEEGVSHAKKVRLDTEKTQIRTYYSATLVLTQLLARGFKITRNVGYLEKFIPPCIESIRNFSNNKRHVYEMTLVSDVQLVVSEISSNPSLNLLTQRMEINEIKNFFDSVKILKYRK